MSRPQLYTVPEVAAMLGTHKQAVYRLIWSDQLAFVDIKVSGKRPRVRIAHAEVERLIRQRTYSRPAAVA